jgi:hypothetical protein
MAYSATNRLYDWAMRLCPTPEPFHMLDLDYSMNRKGGFNALFLCEADRDLKRDRGAGRERAE